MHMRHNFNPPQKNKNKSKKEAIIYCCLNYHSDGKTKSPVWIFFPSSSNRLERRKEKREKEKKKAEWRCQELEKPGKHLPTSWQRTDKNALSEQLHNGTCSLPGVVYQTHLELVPCALSLFFIFILSGLFLDMTALCQKQHTLGFDTCACLFQNVQEGGE